MSTTESVKISTKVLKRVRDRKKITGVSITKFIDIAIEKELDELERQDQKKKSTQNY